MATAKSSQKSPTPYTPSASKPRTRRGSGTLQFFTQEELKRLFAVIKDKRDKALFLLAYRHGLRASEIGHLQRIDVDLKQGRITIHRFKGALSGVYPLQPDLIKLVRPENPKLFANLTFLGFLLMLDQRTSPSSDIPV